MSFSLSYRPLSTEEWIEYLNNDFTRIFPVDRHEKMPVCYDVEWDDGFYPVLCSMTGSYLNGDKLYFTFKRDAPQSVSYTYSEVLEILKKNRGKEVFLWDLDNQKEYPAYYGTGIGGTFFSTFKGSEPK